jgi:chitin synthase
MDKKKTYIPVEICLTDMARFRGETGSGKTTVRSHLLSSLLSYSSTPLSTKLSLAAFVFDSLTTTKSVTTPTASKAGLFFELQYDPSSNNPTLIGGKILDHRLERSRITSVPTGERSIHILYYLLAGTSGAEKAHLGLESSAIHAGTNQKRWRYLGHPTQLKVGINDAEGFQHFKTALRKLEFPRSEIAEICQILATILHIGQLDFVTGQNTTTGAEESGGYSHEGGETVTMVKNKEVLECVAAFLGLGTEDLAVSLRHKSKSIHRERVTVMLDPRGAQQNADELARTLYSLLVAYVIENINQRICAAEDSVANTVSIIDFPGFSQSSYASTLDQLLNNAAVESLYNYCLQSFFSSKADRLESEEVSVPATSYFDNSDAVRGLLKSGHGLLAIIDDQTRRGKSDLQMLESLKKRFENKNPAISVGESETKIPGSNFVTPSTSATFTVRHFAGEIDYPVNGLTEENGEVISGDLINLISTTRSDFVRELFGQSVLQKVTHPKEKSAVVQAQVSSKPMRMPSMARRKISPSSKLNPFGTRSSNDDGDSDSHNGSTKTGVTSRKKTHGDQQGAAGQFLASLDVIKQCLTAPNLNPYFVFCLKPNDRRIANQFDSKCVRMQVQTFGIAEISQRLRNADFSVFLPFAEFLGLAEAESIVVGSDREKAELVLDERKWPGNEARVGSTGVFLSERCWADIAKLGQRVLPTYHANLSNDGDGMLHAQGSYHDSKVRLVNSGENSPSGAFIYGDETKQGGYFGSRDVDGRSDAGASAFNSGDMFKNLETREQMAEKSKERQLEEVDIVPVSSDRKRWLFIVYSLTFFIPDFCIRLLGRMKRKDVRLAWREKLAINLIIWLSCGTAAFIVLGFPRLLCPRQDVYDAADLSSHNGKDGENSLVAVRGVVFNLANFVPNHYPKSIISTTALDKYAGVDATGLFPVQVSALCQGVNGSVDPTILLDYTPVNTSASTTTTSSTDANAQYHDFRYFTNDYRPDWFAEQMIMLKGSYKKGYIGYTSAYMKKLADTDSRSLGSINGNVYDFTDYIAGGRRTLGPNGTAAPAGVNTNFMDEDIVDLFSGKSGQDLTKYFNDLDMDPALLERMQLCMDNLFFIGKVDTRNSVKCQFSEYFILAITAILAAVIVARFLAALQFGRKNMPENLDKFVICQVPAYTEDEDSLRRAMDSMARMKYDDKRKLLVIICDGMIIGQGNDRPTPRIVLDILGVPDTVDPEPLSFESLGEGMKQHNMGKIYSGLYEVQGHIVPFMVVVKVGKPSEVSRPGNRGKRDSQMILMRFLNRIHYNLPMSPMELEMYHQIRNIIGVNPTFYEFILQVDADTVVAPDSATRMVSSFLSDTRILGLCGETALSNSKKSMVTMMQVYEYYISHNLTKAFESLFGSITCLPGCFTMYRIRSADSGKPLFVSKEVVEHYSEIRVDTLHMKNLLHLGEDRYLTTLLLKHHPTYKTKYSFRAHAWTIAPESWAVFLSQRRRWINSTVHNMIELAPMDQMCGFCCFGMRFMVLVDLMSTVIQPVTVAYIVYLIVWIAIDPSYVPVTAFILLAAVYGLQAIIFLLRRKWDMIGWMIIYILATPIFSLALPLYSFWHMDDFSWGNTRVVTGESGKKVVISDEGKFDPASIPKKRWEEYQVELWEAQSRLDDSHSEVSGYSYGTKSYHPAATEYGYPASRPMSQLDLTSRYESRMSLAPSEMLGGTNYELSDLAGLPSDDAILAEIREILRTADLMSITKKAVKVELEKRFGVNLDAKRAYISSGKFLSIHLIIISLSNTFGLMKSFLSSSNRSSSLGSTVICLTPRRCHISLIDNLHA